MRSGVGVGPDSWQSRSTTTWRRSSRKTLKTNFKTTAKWFAKPANPRPFPPLAPFAGKFVNPSFGEATVALHGDALVMEFSNRRKTEA